MFHLFSNVLVRIGVVAIVAAIAYNLIVPPPVSHPTAPALPPKQVEVSFEHEDMVVVWMYTPTLCMYGDDHRVFALTCPKY